MFEKVKVDENEYVRVPRDELFRVVKDVFMAMNVPEEDAEIVAENLVMADLRGVESHGVQRLKRYVDGIKAGGVKINPNIKVVKESPVYAVLDGDEALGQVVAYRAMRMAIEKAKKNGIGIVGVKNSNHYGIAGYYAYKMAKEGLVGMSLTTSRPLVAPTGAMEKFVGTNPIALGAPVEGEEPFLLDMATSVVPSGKIEVYRRKDKPVPEGWGISTENGEIITDPHVILSPKGTILPLGGLGELHGGHKGYGLGVLVDILSGVLMGATWSRHVGGTSDKHSDVGHFFMAIDPGAFGDAEEFKKNMKKMKEELHNAKKHPNFERIWVHGEKGHLTAQTRLEIGIPIYRKVFNEINEIAKEVGVEPLKE
ncbi:MAG: Ldh family oxidoreductase [Euryarchaeota archaeon]|nr:Ldh family oxidoreductase [Euryarchaeota archaeon]